MQHTDYLVLISTETCEGQTCSRDELINYHTASKAHGGLGWNRPGADYLVLNDGTLETIIPEHMPCDVDLWGISSGINGMTGKAKFLAYSGGLTEKGTREKDTRTDAQKATIEAVVKFYIRKFPQIRILGLNQAPALEGATNPGFHVPRWCKEIGLSQVNIFAEQTNQP